MLTALAVAGSIGAASWHADHAKNHVLATPSFYSMFGLDPDSQDMTLMAGIAGIHPDDLGPLTAGCAAHLANPASDTFDGVFRYLLPGDLGVATFQMVFCTHRSSTGVALTSSGVVRDITEQVTSARVLALLTALNAALVSEAVEHDLVERLLAAFTGRCGYRAAHYYRATSTKLVLACAAGEDSFAAQEMARMANMAASTRVTIMEPSGGVSTAAQPTAVATPVIHGDTFCGVLVLWADDQALLGGTARILFEGFMRCFGILLSARTEATFG
jgi:hypothetical protein